MVAPAVPELTEEILHESIEARTEVLIALRELGPPDLVQLIKQAPRNPGKQIGVYHHVTGVDASSSASLAAYINTLTYKETHQSTTKIVEGVYCCYNAFSRLDMRVHVTIPGTVDSYCIDERGEKRSASDELWLETYLCSVLRAYSYADDGSGETIRKIMGVRRFNPVTNTETEHKFLQAAEQLFFRAKVLLMGNEEVQAVRVLHESVKQSPMDYVMLDTQSEFLKKKALNPNSPELKDERLRMSLGCADRSTVAAPSEFGTWARLAEDKDAPIMPEPKDIFLPTLPETRLDEIDSEPESKYGEQVHPSLLTLRAAGYKGTFKHAYSILTEMTAKIGWDQLLKIRSNVFVMEEEYRSEKQPPVGQQGDITKRNPSTDVLRGSPGPPVNGDDHTDDGKSVNDEKSTNGDSTAPTLIAENGVRGSVADESVEKPPHTVTPEEVKGGNEDVGIESYSANASTNISKSEATEEQLSRFNNKRLCERWLDSLFMVLYEDLRIYTIWRTEMAQYRAQSMQYKKSAEEWEILGSLAERLHHQAEAAEAYRACLAIRFSPKALTGILSDVEKEKNTRDTVASVIRLVTWQYRWYSEFSPELLYTIRTLIEDEGAVKVRSIIQATSLPQNVLDLTHHYAALCATFRSSGTEG
ncbi:Uncharacterized protein LAWI1_G001021 [Lachnellula willkommii]|uniref:Bud site selection protein n=1 Tax=Lachnellula willkommii TaxID=215461 RepID=A0A559MM01_9HELO|nr:Uncharacterized protein LAWI1_G001021 [Lachnellula willkommii]